MNEYSTARDPLTEFTAELSRLRAQAEQAQDKVRNVTATATAPDSAVSVTVGPGGALVGITFSRRAYQRSPQALSELVLSLANEARREAGAQVAQAYADLVGSNSDAMSVLKEFQFTDTATGDNGKDNGGNPAIPKPYRPSPRPRGATDDYPGDGW